MPNKLHIHKKLKKGYGWRQPKWPDHRHPKFEVVFDGPLPTQVDMRAQCPPVYDQGQLGSCTANAIGGLAEFLMMKEGHNAFVPSRLFIYYNERVLEGSVPDDAGASISDSVVAVNKWGCPNEALWWYNTGNNKKGVPVFTVKPNHLVYADGVKHLVTNYAQVNQDLNSMKAILASDYPVTVGFTVYDSFESDAVAKTGIVPMPAKTENILGGHAVLVVGYDDSTSYFIVRNSWGTGWGQAGYFMMPYAYLTDSNLSSDFWSAKSVA